MPAMSRLILRMECSSERLPLCVPCSSSIVHLAEMHLLLAVSRYCYRGCIICAWENEYGIAESRRDDRRALTHGECIGTRVSSMVSSPLIAPRNATSKMHNSARNSAASILKMYVFTTITIWNRSTQIYVFKKWIFVTNNLTLSFLFLLNCKI